MKAASLFAAVISLILGIAAAYFWWRSTGKGPSFAFMGNFIQDRTGRTPLDRHQADVVAWNNKIAAILSGLTVLAGAISSVLGAL
jgi:hypothetical protein